MHYLSDVLAGWALGLVVFALCGLATGALAKRLRPAAYRGGAEIQTAFGDVAAWARRSITCRCAA